MDKKEIRTLILHTYCKIWLSSHHYFKLHFRRIPAMA